MIFTYNCNKPVVKNVKKHEGFQQYGIDFQMPTSRGARKSKLVGVLFAVGILLVKHLS